MPRALRTCPTGKLRYRDRLDARIALANTRRKDRAEQRVYHCPFCHGYHLTRGELRRKDQ